MLLNILSGVAEVTLEVINGLFSSTENNETTNNENKTYEYWKNLSYDDQKYYFESNEYLKDYMKNDYYECDRELTAIHVQRIADKLNKEFTNINNRY